MFDRARIKHDFSAAAAQYDRHAGLQQYVLAQLLAKLPPFSPSLRVLDAGCGTGQLQRTLPHIGITQLDIAYAMCAQAAEGGVAVNGAMEVLPFADATFDCVFSSLALQWSPTSLLAVSEMKRILKSSGMLAVSSFGANTLNELSASFSAIDAYRHVSPFAPILPVTAAETVTHYFPDVRSIMRHLKSLGARNKLEDRRRGVMTPSQLEKLEEYYRQHFGTKDGLPVTWKIVYSLIRL